MTDDSFVQTHTDADRLMLHGGQYEVSSKDSVIGGEETRRRHLVTLNTTVTAHFLLFLILQCERGVAAVRSNALSRVELLQPPTP